jgi:hypothetical protein
MSRERITTIVNNFTVSVNATYTIINFRQQLAAYEIGRLNTGRDRLSSLL